MEQKRVILHIDMDAFYASIEQRDNPELRGKPVVVGGSSRRGVVAAASYEARKFGIHSAMPSAIARRRCPNLIFIRARFDVYRSVSNEIREIFLDHTALVEPLSLDEAYLDMSEVVASLSAGEAVARKIRNDIYEATRLRASAGISFNKFLAKMASDVNKPNGQFAITYSEADHFLRELPVQMFHGIGSATAEKMKRLKIEYGKDLLEWPRHRLVEIFGKAGHHYYQIVRGEDRRQVNPNRIRKSVGVERTYGENLIYQKDLSDAVTHLIGLLDERIKRHGRSGKTLTLKLRYDDFTTITRSRTHERLLNKDVIRKLSMELLQASWTKNRQVRLLGLTVSNLDGQNQGKQLRLDL